MLSEDSQTLFKHQTSFLGRNDYYVMPCFSDPYSGGDEIAVRSISSSLSPPTLWSLLQSHAAIVAFEQVTLDLDANTVARTKNVSPGRHSGAQCVHSTTTRTMPLYSEERRRSSRAVPLCVRGVEGWPRRYDRKIAKRLHNEFFFVVAEMPWRPRGAMLAVGVAAPAAAQL